MYIRKVRIERFKSYYEPYELDFDEVKGLWKVSGSVGSGKTTIGEAILFGLFGTITGKNNGDLVSWGQKNGLVELWCRSNGRDIYIKRKLTSSGTSSIYVEVDGEELIFTNKRDAQSQLEKEYFDVSKVTMELLCIISFNNFKSLATLNATDTKKFLDQVLGFYTLTEYTDVCKELRSENDKELSNIERQIQRVTAQIQTLNDMTNMEIIEGDINEYLGKIKEVQDKVTVLKNTVTENVNELNSKNTDLRAKASKIQTLGNAKTKEIQFIEKGICPTCGAPIDQSQLENKKLERGVLLDEYKELGEKIKENTDTINDWNNRFNKAVEPLKKEMEEYKEMVIKLREQAKRKDVNQSEIDRLNVELDELARKYDLCMADSMSWDRLCGILTNDVRAKILESFIPALNKNIMRYATELHQPYIVKFDNSFKCSISLCGYNSDIPISSLSTGQLKTVDMMIILGVLGTVIGASSTNVIFLDELFSNLDGNLRNDMCSVLRCFISENDTMFVISHQDLDERYFDGTIKLHIDHKGQFEKHSTVTLNRNEKNM
jgi:DNA repair exonuclease SbcCD ATPase subunit